jgi:DNA-binding CsgD family transcriptional regulator
MTQTQTIALFVTFMVCLVVLPWCLRPDARRSSTPSSFCPRSSQGSMLSTLLVLVLVGAAIYLLWPYLSSLLPFLKNLHTLFPGQGTGAGLTHQVLRINQLDMAQYASMQQYSLWSGSTCSTAAMTEVMNAYRDPQHRLRIADVLRVEVAQGAISPFKPRQQQVLRALVQGLSLEEVAAVCGLSYANAKSIAKRARDALRGHMQEVSL